MCLALLQPTLLDPIPEHLKASLTVDDLPLDVPVLRRKVINRDGIASG